jgi:hypothetical protein
MVISGHNKNGWRFYSSRRTVLERTRLIWRYRVNKIIHYCWFGPKPLPSLAKKCIKSWKKFLPDFEIKVWNELNIDLDECPFIKQAYEQGKWAFVSDYARMKVLYEHGGIYFDTDMEVTKNIDHLLVNDLFIGREDSGCIAAGVIWVKNKNDKYINDILNFYRSQENFNSKDLFKISIPNVISKCWAKYESDKKQDYELIEGKIFVYNKDFFYPINYDYSKKDFTKNTCMIHYYKADWVSKKEKITIYIYRNLGVKLGKTIIKIISIPKRIIGKVYRKFKNVLLNLKYTIKKIKNIFFDKNKRLKKIEFYISKLKVQDYVVIHNPDWLGVSNSTIDLFNNCLPINDVFTNDESNKISRLLIKSKINTIIFSGLARGYTKIIENIKEVNKNVKIKVLWHGSNALLVENTDFNEFMNLLNLYENKKVDEIVFFKKSLYEFFKKKGYKVSFLSNSVDIDIDKIVKVKKEKDVLQFGLYSSLDRWVKNTYNQISAASLFENSKIDITPMSYKAEIFANKLGLDTNLSIKKNVSREELLAKMGSNDLNLYVTFTECSPMIPLESLELGVPCITGDNNHYFEDTELEKYLVVNKEDNIIEIYNKMKLCLENKDKIIKLYNDWKIENKIKARQYVNDIIN